MKLNFGKEISENIKVLATLISPNQLDLGILITGESYYSSSAKPIIHVHLIEKSNTEWHIKEEIEAFIFSDYISADQFFQDLPEMSALDYLLLIKGFPKNKVFLQ